MMDPAIKLFGTTIPLPDGTSPDPAPAPEYDEASVFVEPVLVDVKDTCADVMNSEAKVQISDAAEGMEQSEHFASSNFDNVSDDEHLESTHYDEESREFKSEKQQCDDSPTAEQKVIKKPDKILPCPRCSSMDTKFCYYNNYNINQPRHFCRKCQRYWTAGGTMRNVPVGAGRRKSKSSASHHRQSEGSSDIMTGNHVDAPDSGVCQALPVGISVAMAPSRPTNNMLQFGSEGPLCESMTSALNLEDQDKNSGRSPLSCGEKGPSSADPRASSNCMENDLPESAAKNGQNHILDCSSGIPPVNQLHYLPVPPWVYPWPPAWYNVASTMPSQCMSESVYSPENGNPNTVPSHPPVISAPAYYSPTLPYPFFPTSFWGCMTSWPNGSWHAPLGSSGGSLLPCYSSINNGCSGISSPTLGKHSRDGTLQEGQTPEKSLWVPKTLRIDDPDGAAKSSIWATLGIKPDESVKKGAMFKHLNCKNETKDQASDAAQVLQANPAALSRSQAFQEIS